MVPTAALALVACGASNDASPASSGPDTLAVAHVTGAYPASCPRQPGADVRLPVSSCTPGDTLPGVDAAHLTVTICDPTWVENQRPPAAETDRVKDAAMLAYGIPPAEKPITELDHLVPLSLGGSSDVRNLWPEVSDKPGKGLHNTKDELELRLHAAVCKGTVQLSAAQAALATNWTTAAQVLKLPETPPATTSATKTP